MGKAESGETYTDPFGTVYLNTNAICDQNSFGASSMYTAYSFFDNDVTTYTTLEFEDDTLKIETRRGDNTELLDRLTLKKTKDFNDNGILQKLHRFIYKFVEFLGIVYQKIDNVVVKIRGGHF